MTLHFNRRGDPVTQKGSALLVSLVMLLLLSLIAVGSMQTTIMQERMSANLRDRDIAFQAAEAALREAETMLRDNAPEFFPNSNGLYVVNADDLPDWPNDVEDSGNGVIEFGGDIESASQKPVYFIEQIDSIVPPGTDLGSFTEAVYFRITALGYGGSSDTTVVISSVYKNI